MRIRIIAIGSRMPRWVRESFEDYSVRFGTRPALELVELDPGARGTSAGATPRAVAVEGQRILGALRKGDFVVALDERGTELTTRELSAWMGTRLQDGRDIAFLIGGPDGLAREVLARSELKWSLSRLTLPHGLVRVVLAEQLYRARSILANHPYHRD